MRDVETLVQGDDGARVGREPADSAVAIDGHRKNALAIAIQDEIGRQHRFLLLALKTNVNLNRHVLVKNKIKIKRAGLLVLVIALAGVAAGCVRHYNITLTNNNLL